MYTHVSKCKNDKLKGVNKQINNKVEKKNVFKISKREKFAQM
jgi:hypothetical protein